MRLARALALAAPLGLLALAAVATAQDTDDTSFHASEDDLRAHNWTVELRFSTVFYPDADQGAPDVPFINFAGNVQSGPPFYDVYGSKHRMLTDLEIDRDLWQKFGSVAVGIDVGYSEFYGNGFIQAPCPAGSGLAGNCFTQFTANSSFHMIPIRLLATYRFDYFVPQHIPVVPFVRAGLDWVIYWNQEQSGSFSYEENGASQTAIGMVTGVEVAGGLMLLLDDIDGHISRDALHDLGISHTYLTASYVDQFIQNGPSNALYFIRTGGNTNPPASLNLSSAYFDFGVAVQF